MKQKYGLSINTSGVYRIRNTVTGDSYVGASVCIANRLSNHFNRDRRRYPHRTMYQDMEKYGVDKFSFDVLELCEKDKLLECEQKWFDQLSPSYNMVRPCENMCLDPEVRKLASIGSARKEVAIARSERYSSTEYVKLFRQIQQKRAKAVVAIAPNGGQHDFDSLSEAARWVTSTTRHTGVNKVSKIREACEGTRKSAYGYTWMYKKV